MKGGFIMVNILEEIKRDLDSFLGHEVSIKANNGRKKIMRKVGILEKTYPRVFVIKVQDEDSPRRLSYSYADILTETVEIKVKGQEDRIGCLNP